MAPQINIEVAYALPDQQVIVKVTLASDRCVEHAILASGILQQFPQIDLATCQVGIFGKRVALDSKLADGDRIELYRPLLADPKESRRTRVARDSGIKKGA